MVMVGHSLLVVHASLALGMSCGGWMQSDGALTIQLKRVQKCTVILGQNSPANSRLQVK